MFRGAWDSFGITGFAWQSEGLSVVSCKGWKWEQIRVFKWEDLRQLFWKLDPLVYFTSTIPNTKKQTTATLQFAYSVNFMTPGLKKNPQKNLLQSKLEAETSPWDMHYMAMWLVLKRSGIIGVSVKRHVFHSVYSCSCNPNSFQVQILNMNVIFFLFSGILHYLILLQHF